MIYPFLLVLSNCGDNPPESSGLPPESSGKPASIEDEDATPSSITGSVMWSTYPDGTKEVVNGLLSNGRSDFPGQTVKEVISAIGRRNDGIARIAYATMKSKGLLDSDVVRWIRIGEAREAGGGIRLNVGIRVITPSKREYMWFGTGIESDSSSARRIFEFD